MGFPDGLDVGHEKKTGVKGNSKVLGPSNWMNGGVIYGA